MVTPSINRTITRKGFLFLSFFAFASSTTLFAQQVDNKNCPDSFKRNNGNGQQVSVFAPNIGTGSIYYLTALKNNNEGMLTLQWGGPIANPPVITRTWTTDKGVTTQNWSFGDNSLGSPFNPPGVPSGNEVKYNFYNNNLPNAGVITLQLQDPVTNSAYATCSYSLSGSSGSRVDSPFGGVSSGNTGGLESESLGSALAERMYTNSVQSVPTKINYSEALPVSEYSRLRSDDLGIIGYMPDRKALGTGFTGYITSPNDILNFTNAVEVMSVDYVEGGINKAVAFCTKTLGGIYSHTKPVCDRLKGSELTSIDTLQYGSYKFLLYNLKAQTGINEYAISFSAGFNQLDAPFTLQSEWLTSSYQAQQSMYNFQLWSSDLGLLNKMLGNVLDKLTVDRPIQQTGKVKKPMTFITKAVRNPKNQLILQLNINNGTAATNGVLVISGKENEQSTRTVVREYPVTLNPFGPTTADLPVNDMAESEVHLMINGVKEDVIYNSDGIWNIYSTPTSVVQAFSISNDTAEPLATEYRLFRNVKLEAVTSDYITVYRMVRGGGVAADLSAYNFLKFSASGNSKVRIRLVGESVTNYDDQYEYLLSLQSKNSEYAIPFRDFKSAASSAAPTLNDLVTISFTYEVSSPGSKLQTELSNVRFAEHSASPELAVSQVIAYPNPTSARLNLEFESSANEDMRLELVNAATGAIVMTQNIQIATGKNQYTTNLSPSHSPGIYIVRLQSDRQRFVSKIMIN
ncbi:T9SS type A sorting domain-containing protein [Persicitalea jodogahamensis]|uniref:Secretion system C-terminal sorting domain-containing protein n=1 Tax=Persicitalea jodogahamensis TaxID=402147 RepID=A0A8J3D557_9BACT|nr:T9SS type A sorting domain-containing protein [Persicitalea jodogahamensis]GHB54731.1 hypothetical protein GCM10007390_04800 [Persicitalea jodogahamensis]